MNYLKAVLQPASLFSMRLPYTHQSALTYPLPPPSTILGMLAAALQRAEDRPPLECLEEIEAGIDTCAALVDEDMPVAARSCVVSLITKIQAAGEGKVTDALPRQFAHTHRVALLAFSEDAPLLDRLAQVLTRSPVTLGGSESLAAPQELTVAEAAVEEVAAGELISTRGYVPRDLLDTDSLGERHSLFWVHERCLGADELVAYLYPVMLDGYVYRPAPIEGALAWNGTCYRADGETVLTHHSR
ncbi:MAG: CRISPR-associated protein Cas5 [Armatimonadota bacterium]